MTLVLSSFLLLLKDDSIDNIIILFFSIYHTAVFIVTSCLQFLHKCTYNVQYMYMYIYSTYTCICIVVYLNTCTFTYQVHVPCGPPLMDSCVNRRVLWCMCNGLGPSYGYNQLVTSQHSKDTLLDFPSIVGFCN